MIHKAILLAAGRGTRLGSITATCPKPMLEVAGRPIIGHILAGLKTAGLSEVIVVTGYLHRILEERLGDGTDFGLQLRYVRQERTDGTARAITLGREHLEHEPFFFGWGDILVQPENYPRIVEAAADAAAVLAVNEVEDPWAGAAVYVDDNGLVEQLVEKPPRGTSTTRWNNAGFGVLGPSIWPYVDALKPSSRGEYELPQAIAALVADGAAVRAVPVRGTWFDIGTAEDLQTARVQFARRD